MSLSYGQSPHGQEENSIFVLTEFEKEHYNNVHDNEFNRLLMVDPSMTDDVALKAAQKIQNHIEALRRNQTKKKTSSFLKMVFFKTHDKFLRRYRKHAMFSESFDQKGSYDCVTGTALLSYVYAQLGFHTIIRETTFHMYLLIKTDEQLYLVESTDPLNGFIKDAGTIGRRMKEYALEKDSSGYQFKASVNNEIDMEHLIALQYYNRAIHLYNLGESEHAYNNILKASSLYDSRRVVEIRDLIISNLNMEVSSR